MADLQSWLDAGRALGAARRAAHWALADWAARGVAEHGPEAARAAGEPPALLAPETLLKLARTGRRWPPEHPSRALPDVPYGVFESLVALPDEAAGPLLESAAREGWSVARARSEAGAARAGDGPRVTGSWTHAARAAEREVSESLATAEAAVRRAVEAIEALAAHEGMGDAHGHSRRSARRRLDELVGGGAMAVPSDGALSRARGALEAIWRSPRAPAAAPGRRFKAPGDVPAEG